MSRRTIRSRVSLTGIGCFTGQKITVTLCPADLGTGIIFRRVDKNENRDIQVCIQSVASTVLNTTLSNGMHSIFIAEHLLATIWGFKISDIIIELNGDEVPLLDGSASQFLFAIRSAGVKQFEEEDALLPVLNITNELCVVGDNESYIKCRPYDNGLVIDYTIDYPEKSIGIDRFVFNSDTMSFGEELANARTFCTAKELQHRDCITEHWNKYNAIIFHEDKIEVENNNQLRYTNEATRHKILDLIGDLMISGYFINGYFECYKSGHTLNYELLRQILTTEGKH